MGLILTKALNIAEQTSSLLFFTQPLKINCDHSKALRNTKNTQSNTLIHKLNFLQITMQNAAPRNRRMLELMTFSDS